MQIARITTITAVAFICIVVLPCIPWAVDMSSTVECTVVAEYEDGHNATMAVLSYIPAIGDKKIYGGMRYVVTHVTDYWYEGLPLGKQYYFARVMVCR
jgi:hypothetical protein